MSMPTCRRIVLIALAASLAAAALPRAARGADWALPKSALGKGAEERPTSVSLEAAAPASSPVNREFAIQAESRLEPARDSYPANLNFDFIVEARWKGELGAVTVHVPDAPELENARMVSLSTANRTHPESGEASAEYRFRLAPLAQGEARVGRVNLEYVHGGGPLATLTAEGAALRIGPPRRDWGRIAAWGGAAATGALGIAGGLIWLGVAIARKSRPVAPPPSPFDALRERMAGMENCLIEGDFSRYHGEARDCLLAAMSLAGLWQGKRSPTASELAEWLAGQPDSTREAGRDWLAILEQAEAVRFAAKRPAADENRAARKRLEQAIDWLERAALRPDEEKPNKQSRRKESRET